MKIRSSLMLACFLLSVVPLGGIVVYSYYASRRALESAYQREAARMTAQMDQRLASIRQEMQERLAEVSALPAPSVGNVAMTMADVAPLVESVEIHPDIPQAPMPPVVIQMPQFGRQQRDAIRKITELSRAMGEPALADAQRADLQRKLADAQKAFEQSMRVREKAIQKQAEAATRQRVRVGRAEANVRVDRVVRRVLDSARDAGPDSEITFAIDKEGNVYTQSDEQKQRLESAGIPQRMIAGKPLDGIRNWVVVSRSDPQTGLQIGVARPFGEDLEELRKTAAKNFGYGIALIFIAVIGIVPIANHITGDVELVTRGAERIAYGDLTTRLPVHSRNEIGQLATAFNRMAQDLSLQQQRIVEQERAAIEYERKSAELEEARRFQLSMLPKEVPRLDAYDIAVFTHTATEVGGDYYDFHVDDGSVAITIGDATGHGARAGTMVAVIKALFAGYSADSTPSHFLSGAAEKVRRMDLGRMAMALLLARFHGRTVTVASAGMPPVYVHRRATGSIDEISIGATPLGTIGDGYRDTRVDLAPGDTMLFMSDGFPELMNEAGQQLGYGAAVEAFAAAATASDASAVIASLENAARNWHGDQAPNDDVTFVVVRAREEGRSSFA